MAERAKKTPMRMCAGCREMKPKRELLRVVRSPEGLISVDEGAGKKPGRGVYLCPSKECVAKARKAKAIERALESAVMPEIYEEILNRIIVRD